MLRERVALRERVERVTTTTERETGYQRECVKKERRERERA